VRTTVVVLPLLGCSTAAAQGPPAATFDSTFDDVTLRVDFYQVGNATTEMVSLDRLIRQGPWAGPCTLLADPFRLGRYAVELHDPAGDQLLFERGFDSYFGEYRTTEAARGGTVRAYHNSMLVPMPKRPAVLVISARAAGAPSVELLRQPIDPASPEIAAEAPAPDAIVVEAHSGGDPHRTLDIAIIGEGYLASEAARFRDDLARVTGVLLGFEPYASYRDRIAVRGVLVPSASSGIDEPSRGRFRSTAINATFDSLGSERYLLTEDNRALRDVAANVPYDVLIIMVNHDRYGGGGIYNAYCTFTARSSWSDYLLLHELGHSFAGLADEYYTSDVAYSDFYPPGTEPAERNITALLSPGGLKWRSLVEEGTPIPTPWDKAAFDAASLEYEARRRELNERIALASRSGDPLGEVAGLEQEAERLALEHTEFTRRALAGEPFAGQVGAFEGAGYASTGLYRPMLDCLMFRRGVQPFCRVCQQAVADAILHFTGGDRGGGGRP
jgi:hypothetical protein